MTDLSKTIAPKSDQLNADDLIGGQTLTIKITSVRGCDEADQPVAVHFEGDNGKPYKPCKSMRRVMVHCWGTDGKTYPGRSMTLFRDENVQFGGIKVGGIRISHMSHIDKEAVIPLTTKRAKREPFTVKPLKGSSAPAPEKRVTRPEPEAPQVVEQTHDESDPLSLNFATATDDQIAAWVELFKVMGMKQKTSADLLALWKAHFETHIKVLHQKKEAMYSSLYDWMEERHKRLKASENTSG